MLKKKTLKILIFLAFAIPAGALELEIQGGMGNIAFKKDREAPLAESVESTDPDPNVKFKPEFFDILKAEVSGEGGANFYFNGGFEQDPILRNRLYANMGIRLDHFTLEAGSFFGIFNSGEVMLNPGFSISANLEFPEIFFVSLKASSSLGSNTGITGNYNQRTSGFQAGLWVPYVIFSLNIENRNFTLQKKNYLLTEDNLTRYFSRSEVFTKNKPYTIIIDIGYQNLGRSYYTQDIARDEEGNFDIDADPVLVKIKKTDELKSLFLGFEGIWNISPSLKFLLAAEMPIFSWGSGKMKGPEPKAVLFEARAGIIWALPSF
ncbi:MAG: hypothetical protein LBH43_07400 [Treponema sp.]|nr:hypothetical protein [Treponema sp.]